MPSLRKRKATSSTIDIDGKATFDGLINGSLTKETLRVEEGAILLAIDQARPLKKARHDTDEPRFQNTGTAAYILKSLMLPVEYAMRNFLMARQIVRGFTGMTIEEEQLEQPETFHGDDSNGLDDNCGQALDGHGPNLPEHSKEDTDTDTDDGISDDNLSSPAAEAFKTPPSSWSSSEWDHQIGEPSSFAEKAPSPAKTNDLQHGRGYSFEDRLSDSVYTVGATASSVSDAAYDLAIVDGKDDLRKSIQPHSSLEYKGIHGEEKAARGIDAELLEVDIISLSPQTDKSSILPYNTHQLLSPPKSDNLKQCEGAPSDTHDSRKSSPDPGSPPTTIDGPHTYHPQTGIFADHPVIVFPKGLKPEYDKCRDPTKVTLDSAACANAISGKYASELAEMGLERLELREPIIIKGIGGQESEIREIVWLGTEWFKGTKRVYIKYLIIEDNDDFRLLWGSNTLAEHGIFKEKISGRIYVATAKNSLQLSEGMSQPDHGA